MYVKFYLLRRPNDEKTVKSTCTARPPWCSGCRPEVIMDLLSLCLTSTYILSVQRETVQAVARNSYGVTGFSCCRRNCDSNIEEHALGTCRQRIQLRLSHVDDTFAAVHKDEIHSFHNHLNDHNTEIEEKIEEHGKLRFLDCLVSGNNNELRATIYRKPTHTDRVLDESSYNPTSYKATSIKTLTRRAQLIQLRHTGQFIRREQVPWPCF